MTFSPPPSRPARPVVIDRQFQIDLAIFNAGVVRARREYEAHPVVNSCPPQHKCGFRLAGGLS